MTAIELVALVALAAWLVLALDSSRAWPRAMRLSDRSDSELKEPTSVIAIVPARNEAESLPATLPSLLTQGRSLTRILVVDDGSDDATADIARQIAANTDTDCRLEVLVCDSRPAGWSGKVHAQQEAYRHLTREIELGREAPEWVLLTDADIRHRPGSLESLLQRASGGRDGDSYDLVSVMARLRAAGFWERLLVPSFVFFFHLLYPFVRVRDPDSKLAAAAGGCVLVRWERLVAANGFESIKGQIIDDVAFAGAIQATGASIWLGLDAGIESVRSYRRLQDLWRMVSRSAFAQLEYNWLLLLGTLAALTMLVVSPPLLIGWICISWLVDYGSLSGASVRTLIWAASTWLLMSRALYPWVRHHGVPARYAASLPISATLFGLMTATSAWDHLTGRGARWRGRSYRASE